MNISVNAFMLSCFIMTVNFMILYNKDIECEKVFVYILINNLSLFMLSVMSIDYEIAPLNILLCFFLLAYSSYISSTKCMKDNSSTFSNIMLIFNAVEDLVFFFLFFAE